MRKPSTSTLDRRLLICSALVILAGCAAAPATKLARYDFADASSAQSAATSRAAPKLPALSAINVSASSWLAGRDMHYRLLYAEPLRRFAYAEAQWAAPPAELLERDLRKALLFAAGAAPAGGCRLGVVLTELDQRFAQPERSAVHLAVQASAHLPRGDAVIGRQAFTLEVPSASADARGGVAATGIAVQRLVDELDLWLAALPQASRQRCQTGKD